MRRSVGILVLLLALVGAFVLGRCTATRNADATQAAGPTGMGAGTDVSAAGEATNEGLESVQRTPERGVAPFPAISSADGGLRRAMSAQQDGRDTTPPSSSGPQPLQLEDAEKLARAEAHLSAEGGTWRDLLDLSSREEQDDAARRLEQRIAQSILRHGGHQILLRLAPPHCTRSLCIVRGVGGGRGGSDPRSDWQQLSMAIMNEPWFSESFDDMRSSVSGDGGETVYLTIFVRCEQGRCRLGSR